jgi:uncharacterized OB-fold protein
MAYHVFKESLKDGRLLGLKCSQCQTLVIPPSAVCPACRGSRFEPHAFSGQGVLRTFTIIRVGPSGFPTPYVIAMAELAEGPWLMGNLVGIDPEAVDMSLMGAPVSVGAVIVSNESGEGPEEGLAFAFRLNG